jgi:hypothetical protein
MKTNKTFGNIFMIALLGIAFLAGTTVFGNDNGRHESNLQVRFVHAAPYAGPVDVWNERSIIAPEFDYGEVSDRIRVTRSRNRFISLALAGTRDVVAEFDLGLLDAGFSYTVIVHNTRGGSRRDLSYGLNAIISRDPVAYKDFRGLLLSAAHTAADVGKVRINLQENVLSTQQNWLTVDQGDITGFFKTLTPSSLNIDATFDGRSDIVFEIPSIPDDEYVYGFVVSDKTGIYLFALFSDNTLVAIEPGLPVSSPADFENPELAVNIPAEKRFGRDGIVRSVDKPEIIIGPPYRSINDPLQGN